MRNRLILACVALTVMGGYLSCKRTEKKKLDIYYLDALQMVKSGMIYGSSVDSQDDLGRHQDHIEVCMHLDGYNGPQIMELRYKAFENAMLKGKK